MFSRGNIYIFLDLDGIKICRTNSRKEKGKENERENE